MVVVNRKERICKIIEFAVPGDSRIEEKEIEGVGKSWEWSYRRYGMLQ